MFVCSSSGGLCLLPIPASPSNATIACMSNLLTSASVASPSFVLRHYSYPSPPHSLLPSSLPPSFPQRMGGSQGQPRRHQVHRERVGGDRQDGRTNTQEGRGGYSRGVEAAVALREEYQINEGKNDFKAGACGLVCVRLFVVVLLVFFGFFFFFLSLSFRS